MFLFSDTQIVLESFLEDINNVLNSGEVPTLFDQADLEIIFEAMDRLLRAEGKPVSKITLMNRFARRVRQNLHVVLAFSPVGSAFRNRLRMFPSLVNCCTIDWSGSTSFSLHLFHCFCSLAHLFVFLGLLDSGRLV